MKKNILFVLIYTFCFSLQAQNIIVIDSISSEILPYASISHQKTSGITFVIASNIGYKTKIVKNYNAGDTIPLCPTIYSIKEVEVMAKKRTQYYHLGYYNEKRLFYNIYSMTALPGRLLSALKVLPKDTSDFIEGVYLPLRYKASEKDNEFNFFKLYIMNVGIDGFPKDTILKRLININEYKRKVYLNINEHYLKIPSEGIFIVFEWGKENYDYSRKLSIVTTTKNKTNFSYIYRKGKWFPWLTGTNHVTNFNAGFKMRVE